MKSTTRRPRLTNNHETMLLSTESRPPPPTPQNRKVRHLRGVYLRNLSFLRPEGRTVDDAAINTTANKLEVLRDTPSCSMRYLLRTCGRQRCDDDAPSLPGRRQPRDSENSRMQVEGRAADVFFELRIDGEEESVCSSRGDRAIHGKTISIPRRMACIDNCLL